VHRICLLYILCILVSCSFGRSEENRIKARLSQVASLATVKGDEHPFTSLRVAKELSSFFAFPLKIDMSSSEYERLFSFSKQEFQQKVGVGRKTFQSIEISVEPLEIDVKRDMASADVRVNVLGKLSSEEEQFLEIRVVNVQLQLEDDWKIVGVTHLRNERE
jgi:hypothetical protein